MSLSSSQKSRSTLVAALGVTLLCTALLAGCAAVGNLWTASSESKQRDDKLAAIIFSEDATAPVSESPVEAKPAVADAAVEISTAASTNLPIFKSDAEQAQQGILGYWEMISGGEAASGAFLGLIAGDRQIKLVRPVAVCVRGDLVYIVDMGLNSVLRYHRISGEIEAVLDLTNVVSGDVADIFVTKDLSFYITDTYGARVLRFSHNGKLLQIYKNRLNLVHPVSVVEDDSTGSVLIADGEFDHVVVFNQMGDPYTTIGRRGQEPGEFLNITAMALTNTDVYVATRVGGKIQVLSRDGEYLYSMEQGIMRFPLSLVVGEGRIFVSDYLDNTIKIFERGRLVETAGGTGREPGKFKRITDMWLEDGFLFAVDSLNARVQVMKVAGSMATPAIPSLGP